MHRFELLRLCALWDVPSEHRVSIPTVALLLDDTAVQALADSSILDSWRRQGKIEAWQEERARGTSAKLRKALRISRRVEAAQRMQRFRSFRNTFLAHTLQRAATKAPKYGEERWMLRLSIEIVHRFYLGLSNTDYMFDHTIEQARRNARNLWRGCSFAIEKYQ